MLYIFYMFIALFIDSMRLRSGYYTWMGDCLRADEPSRYITSHQDQFSLLTFSGRKIEYRPVWMRLSWGPFTCVGCECDPIWQLCDGFVVVVVGVLLAGANCRHGRPRSSRLHDPLSTVATHLLIKLSSP